MSAALILTAAIAVIALIAAIASLTIAALALQAARAADRDAAVLDEEGYRIRTRLAELERADG